jgi:hypothetical protein
MPAITFGAELYLDCNQANACKTNETGCRPCSTSRWKNDLFNKNISKVSYAKGLSINANSWYAEKCHLKRHTDIEILAYKHGEQDL